MALISHEHRSIFIHCPKTGGTSIGYGLEAVGFVRAWQDEEWRTENWQHQYDVPPRFDDYEVFTVCRNPFDRFVSLWAYKTQNEEGFPQPDLSFADFRPAERLCGLGRYQFMYVQRADVVLDFREIATTDYFYRFGDNWVLPWMNETTHDPWWTYYDDERAAWVVDYYDHDFDLPQFPSRDWRWYMERAA